MKYKAALEERSITIDVLPKTTQKLIRDLEKKNSYIETLDKEDFDDEETKANYDEIIQYVNELDEEIVKKIYKFNPEIYEKKKRVFEENRIKGGSQKPKKEEIEEEIEEELDEIEEVEKVEVVSENKDAEKINNISKKLQDIKETLTLDTKKFKPKPEQEILEPEVEEIEEFEKKADIKPKKGSTAMIIMALGLGILTFGSVMFFKDRR